MTPADEANGVALNLQPCKIAPPPPRAYEGIVDAYFRENSVVSHHVDSYNTFARSGIQAIVEAFNPITVAHESLPGAKLSMSFFRPTMVKPTIVESNGSTKIMTPKDARDRAYSYSANLLADLVVTSECGSEHDKRVETHTFSGVCVGRIPIMVRSDYCTLSSVRGLAESSPEMECRFDPGGYFIINGNEKCVIPQDRVAENTAFVFTSTKLSASYCLVSEVRSSTPDSVPKLTQVKLSTRQTQFGRPIRVSAYGFKHDVPLVTLMKALGVASDRNIVRYVALDMDAPLTRVIESGLLASIDEASSAVSQQAALATVGAAMTHLVDAHPEVILRQLCRDILPHVGGKPLRKALYIGHMVRKLLLVSLGLAPQDDRDNYVNKRVDSCGVLFSNLFRQTFNKLTKDARNMLQKEVNAGAWRASNRLILAVTRANIVKIVKASIVESGMRYALSTGNWGFKNAAKAKQGVAQVLSRLTYNGTISHLRRMATPVEKTGKLILPRKLASSQWGFICPAETPEGASVGIVKNLAMTAHITLPQATSTTDALRVFLLSLPNVRDIDDVIEVTRDIEAIARNTAIIVNGAVIGVCADAPRFVQAARDAKRRGEINVHTSVVWDIRRGQVRVCNDGGRLTRPLGVASAAHRVAEGWPVGLAGRTFTSAVLEGVIEFVDAEESANALIGVSSADPPDTFTHFELHPSLMYGWMASTIPFSDCSQAPRNAYSSSQCKQAVGMYATNYRHRFDTVSHTLAYPQRPLVATRLSRHVMHNDDMPCGINAIVALQLFTGFNQEDSLIVNQSAVERGLFASFAYKTHRDVASKNFSTGDEETYCIPSAPSASRPYVYTKIGPEGFCPEGTRVEAGDVIMGKQMPFRNAGGKMAYRDCSVAIKNNEQGVVDSNVFHDKRMRTTNADGLSFAKVRIRSERVPAIGDKFSSRSGQKGTCGIMYAEQDMPFTEDGIIPDLVMNCHAIPSRMTVNQLVEMLMGSAAAQLGMLGDGTPFNGVTMDRVASVLSSLGLDAYGDHVMRDPRTGRALPCRIFMGPCLYSRLKHIASDKLHARGGSGPVVQLTRQPAEGRARDGGLKNGEMEIDAMAAHGVLGFLKERLVDTSDNYKMFVCRSCGETLAAIVNDNTGTRCCRACGNLVDFGEVRIPFATKLFLQELQAMNIDVRVNTIPDIPQKVN